MEAIRYGISLGIGIKLMTVPSQSSLPKLRQISLSIFVVLWLGILSGLRFPILHQVFQEWPKLHAATATFVALCIGVIPFILLGSMASATVAIMMTPSRWARIIPAHPFAAILIAACCGMITPSCECASVPLARRMMLSGVPAGAAITFMIAAPSLNPVVIYATMTAFNSWQIAIARWTAGLMAVIGVGMIVTFFGHRAFNKLVPVDELVCHSVSRQRVSKKNQWLQAMSHDALSSLTFVIIGAGCAAIATTLLPRSFMSVVQNNIVMSILVMMGLAMMLSLCSLGDAFVAASFSALPLASLLVFLVLGPIIDLKLAALMDGMLGVQATKVIALAGVCMALISTIIVAGIWGWLS